MALKLRHWVHRWRQDDDDVISGPPGGAGGCFGQKKLDQEEDHKLVLVDAVVVVVVAAAASERLIRQIWWGKIVVDRVVVLLVLMVLVVWLLDAVLLLLLLPVDTGLVACSTPSSIVMGGSGANGGVSGCSGHQRGSVGGNVQFFWANVPRMHCAWWSSVHLTGANDTADPTTSIIVTMIIPRRFHRRRSLYAGSDCGSSCRSRMRTAATTINPHQTRRR